MSIEHGMVIRPTENPLADYTDLVGYRIVEGRHGTALFGTIPVSEQHPEWSPLVRQWRELEALYRRELPSGSCPLTHARMRALGEEAEGVPGATVDLSNLETTGEPGDRTGPYFDALDDVLGVMIDRYEELPDRLYVGIPPAPGARVLMWSRQGSDTTVERAVRQMKGGNGG